MNDSIARTTDKTDPADIVMTMCCTCATTRTVARRSARNPRLRCKTCGTATRHEPLGLGGDWREELNQQDNEHLKVRERLIRRAADVGVVVRIEVINHGVPAECRRYEGGDYDGFWYASVNSDLPIDEQIDSIKWVWGTILKASFDGDLCTDRRGHTYRGHYRQP